MTAERYDALKRRCPRLGGLVTFEYCRGCGDAGFFCFKTVDCWWEYFDIVSYLREQVPADRLAPLLDPKPKPKVSSLLELIAQARERCGK